MRVAAKPSSVVAPGQPHLDADKGHPSPHIRVCLNRVEFPSSLHRALDTDNVNHAVLDHRSQANLQLRQRLEVQRLPHDVAQPRNVALVRHLELRRRPPNTLDPSQHVSPPRLLRSVPRIKQHVPLRLCQPKLAVVLPCELNDVVEESVLDKVGLRVELVELLDRPPQVPRRQPLLLPVHQRTAEAVRLHHVLGKRRRRVRPAPLHNPKHSLDALCRHAASPQPLRQPVIRRRPRIKVAR
mmetsp:Transcript_186/g.488  ORF Transcript_186/g.488 Transcript_186/m.488 type:complete len:240 (+) Transcript_186:308-1027(+)